MQEATREARYVGIGGVAAVIHGLPRMTFDLDLLIDPAPGNTQAVVDALRDAGILGTDRIEAADLIGEGVAALGCTFNIDVLTRTPQTSFAAACERRETVTLDGVPVGMLSRADLIASRRARGQREGTEDVDALRRIERGEV